jgi:hypothetical protein
MEDCSDDYPTTLLGQYVDRATSEAAVLRHHRDRAVQDFMSGSSYFFDTASNSESNANFWRFPLLDWCRTHLIPIRVPGELREDYAIQFAQVPPELAVIPAVNQLFSREYNDEVEPAADDDESDIHRHLGWQMVAFLVAAQQHDLMAQLWLEVIGPLAFIHEQAVSQITYCDFQADGAILLLKNQ